MQGICFAGFSREDFMRAQQWLQQMEPGMRICCIREDMHYELLQDAIYEHIDGEQVGNSILKASAVQMTALCARAVHQSPVAAIRAATARPRLQHEPMRDVVDHQPDVM